ncbi:MAG: HTH domain-containing protein [Microcoleus sp.]
MSKTYTYLEPIELLRALPKDRSPLTVRQLATRLSVADRTIRNRYQPLLESKLVEMVPINKKQYGYRRSAQCNI